MLPVLPPQQLTESTRPKALRSSWVAVSVCLLTFSCASPGGGEHPHSAPEPSTEAPDRAPAEPQFLLQPGTRSEGDREIAVGEGRATDRDDAIAQARADALRRLAELRASHVRSLTEIYSSSQEQDWMTDHIELSSSTSISGSEFGAPEVHEASTGESIARIRCAADRMFVNPGDHLRSIRSESPHELADACKDMIAQAQSFDPPDLTMASIALRTLIHAEPTIDRVVQLSGLMKRAGRPSASLQLLHQYHSRLVAKDHAGTLQKMIEELSSAKADVGTLLYRLDRMSVGGSELTARYERVRYDEPQTIDGYVPVGTKARIFWIDGEVLAKVVALATPTDQGGTESGVRRIRYTCPSFVDTPEQFLEGKTHLLVLTTQQRLPDFPDVEDPIRLELDPQHTEADLARLEDFVNRVSDWLTDEQNQAELVHWTQVP